MLGDWLTPAVCCMLLALQLFAAIGHWSQTADESTHLYAGYRYLHCGDFGFSPAHPPVARMVAALPLLYSRLSVNCSNPGRDEALAALDWLYARDFRKILLRARLAMSIFALALCVLVWMAARRMFGRGAALVATLLLVFEPNLLAHGALVTTDMALTCAMFFSVFAFYLWTTRHRMSDLLLAAAATGLAVTTKQSGILTLPILALLALCDARIEANQRRARILPRLVRNLGAVIVIGLIAMGIVWAAYGFRFMAHADGAPLPALNADRGSFAGLLQAMRHDRLLPEAYLQGIQAARVLARGQGAPLLFLRRLYPAPPWFFFPVNLVIKLTVTEMALLLLTLAGTGLTFVRRAAPNTPTVDGRDSARREWLFMTLPPAFYLLICMMGHISSGIRHVLPMTPFLLVLAAAGSVRWTRRVRWAGFAVALLVGLHIASSLHAYPNYLSYANELWGGPANAYLYLPNNDWGEAWYAVRDYAAAHPGEPCWLASPYLMSIRYYHLPCRQFWGGDPREMELIPPQVRGFVVLSSAFFDNAVFIHPGSVPDPELAPFLNRAPTAKLGGSAMLVYEGDFNTVEAAASSEYARALSLANAGRFDQALAHARRAAGFAPDRALVRFEYCRDLVAAGEAGLAARECRVARDLLLPEDHWMGAVPSVSPLGYVHPWGPARLHLVDVLLHAIGAE